MQDADRVILSVLHKAGSRVPATKLVKLVYLVDYIHYQHYGRTVTGLEYQWDHYGPNAVRHGIIRAAERLSTEGVVDYRAENTSFGNVTKWFGLNPSAELPPLDEEAEMAIGDVVHRFGKLSVQAITAETKKTAPFRAASQYDLLKMEQSAPAFGATPEDLQAFFRDVEDNGTISLEEVKREYGLA